MRSGECNAVSLYVCIALSMDLMFFCVACLTNYFTKQFAICLGVFFILLLNVKELLCVVGGALLDRPYNGLP